MSIITFRGGPLDGQTIQFDHPPVCDVKCGETTYLLRGNEFVEFERFWKERKAAQK